MSTKFASKIEVVYMSVQDNSGKTFQKPYMKISEFEGDEVYIQLRNDLNVAEFSRLLMSGLDYNVVSTSAEFAPLKNSEVENENKESENIENTPEETENNV